LSKKTQNINLSLSELNSIVKKTFENNFIQTYRIIAEISEINESRGHAYLELIETDIVDNKIIAKARATIWSSIFRMLKPYFETTTGRPLQIGMKILIVVSIEFHEIFGYSLNIRDIDPTYTIGDIELRRNIIIKQLKEDGIFSMNKELNIPSVPQKIAVISSETAAGYGDFINQLNNNKFGYKFYVKLFSAVMQGEKSEISILNAFDKIFEYENLFDVVVIIRGGGSKSDLSCFDSYQTALNIAQFPLPVISGIGHDRDESVVDLVSNISLKTPTAVADFLISKLHDFESFISELENEFLNFTKDFFKEKTSEIEQLSFNLKFLVKNKLTEKESELLIIQKETESVLKQFFSLKNLKTKDIVNLLQFSILRNLDLNNNKIEKYNTFLKDKTTKYLNSKQHKLIIFEQKTELLNPENILKRGFSYSLFNGKVLKNINEINESDVVETVLFNGRFTSIILKKLK